MHILEVSRLSKIFPTPSGPFRAVNDVTFSLKEGEILGLLGRNGAGKTTTIQMLLGALTPTGGNIHYFGKNLEMHREQILEQVNFSSTYTDFPWTLTVGENLTFFSYLYTIPDRKKRIMKIVDSFQLQSLFNVQMQDLSAGQRTRVGLAKAFLNFPRVLLLDEPTASLDPDIAAYIRAFLLRERKNFQVSIIITSHNMAEVEEICDRVIFIDKGTIIADDTPENLAKSLEVAHVELMMKDGMKRTIEYCEKKNLKHRPEGRYIVVDVKEHEIALFLREIMDRGVIYDEISIEKPSLEDYFLQITHKKKGALNEAA